MSLDDLIIKSNGARKEIFDKEENCSDYRFKNKHVYEKLVIFDSKNFSSCTLNGRGSISLSSKYTKTNPFALCLSTSTDIENITPRPSSSLRFALNGLNLEKYNRISALCYIEATGYQNFYFHFAFGNDGHHTNHAPSIYPNQWTYVTWECDHIKRDNVNLMTVTPYLMGCPPEALPNINIYIDNISAEVVDLEYDLGWDLEDRIAYSHVGYLPISKKQAFSSTCNSDYFTVVNEDTLKSVRIKVKEIDSNLGHFYLFDFSSINEIGNYHLEVDNRKTESFLIDFVCYDSSIWKSLNFLRSLRCGEDVEGVHSACHLNCRSVHPDGRTVPTFGGWHDAGDVSQFEICTAEMAHAICDLALKNKADSFMFNRLLEEAKVGLNWLLRTRFGDGYRANAVGYSIWRKNTLDPTNTSIISKAEEGSFENFLSAAALASGANLFKDLDIIYSDWCKRSAIEDFKFACSEYLNKIYTVRWGEPIESQTMGAAILAACEIYVITNDIFYLEKALEFSKIVMNCQEKGNDTPMKGFFYEDQEHKYILAYEHRGHEQSPVQGLARLYQLLPSGEDKDKIKKSLELYRSYVLESMKYTKPYNLLPGHIYHVDKINIEHFTVFPKTAKLEALQSLIAQVKEGIDLGNGWYLRIMPIAYTRRGFHATLLSKAKGVSMIAKVFNDTELRNIVISQLEWILGKNPFASSTMYGEGHNYHPLYVAFSRQIVGALPVGIKTKDEKDLPYWPTINNAVYKEIWGHTTGKYLWVLADVL